MVAIDIIPLDLNFINHDKFTEGKSNKQYRKNASDKEIFKQAKTDQLVAYRVHDLNNSFNNSIPSYHHHLVGGYSGLKMQRIQDLIDSTLHRENYLITANYNQMMQNKVPLEFANQQIQNRVLKELDILNMFNAQYIMFNYNGNVIKNPNALGNAWFVDEIKEVNSASEEINTIKNAPTFDPVKTAVVDTKKFPNVSKSTSSQGTIKLTSYEPNELKYVAENKSNSTVVFSEIYYPAGWNAYIDDKPVEHFRANYVLRALNVPAGKHNIVFKFEPKSYSSGNSISRIASIIITLLLLASIGLGVKKELATA